MPKAQARAPAMSLSAYRLPGSTGTNGLPALHLLSPRLDLLLAGASRTRWVLGSVKRM